MAEAPRVGKSPGEDDEDLPPSSAMNGLLGAVDGGSDLDGDADDHTTDGSPSVFMDSSEFDALESFHSLVLASPARGEDDDDDHSPSSGFKLELEMAEAELSEMRENLSRANSRISELEEKLKTQEAIAREAESKRQVASAAEKRAEDIVAQLSERLATKDAELYALRKENEEKVSKLTHQVNSAVKDKEAMVMRYAQSEKEVIIAKRDKENLERKLNDMTKEKDGLVSKLKNMANDKAKLAHSLDTKTSEVFQLVKEAERLKEEIVSRDVKIKWGQNKLKSEMDAHQETKAQLDKSYRQLQDLREEANQVRLDCQNVLKSYQEESGSSSGKGPGAEMPQPESEDLRQIQELHDLKGRHASAVDENLSLSQKIQKLETERLDHEHSVAQLKDTISQLRKEAAQARKNVQELDHTRSELTREKELRFAAEAEIAELKAAVDDLTMDMASCRHKEAELLEFSATLTEKNVGLQSELRGVEAQLARAQSELAAARRRAAELEADAADGEAVSGRLQAELDVERREAAGFRAAAEGAARGLETRILELEDEVKVLRKRNAAGIKALTKELETCAKRLELNRGAGGREGPSLAPARSSPSPSKRNGPAPASTSTESSQERHQASSSEKPGSPKDVQQQNQQQPTAVLVPSQEMLVEKIVRLQQVLARRKEKMEVLEEHRRHLVRELRKKTAIIQHYVLKEGDQHQAIVSEDRDRHKAQMARYGGIMASVYNSRASDGSMTLELSLEINRKLQAVLEDTLMKNITLKENLNTLGDEIARLTQHHQKKQRALETKIKDLETGSKFKAPSVEDDT